ncbi:MAG: DNA-processing protein DprA [Clostridiales bacterium]|nr:DNA-processing protein DprA [Clostridiales bacterium]
MDRKLASDLFCSLLMANHIMSGNQILSTISRAGIETIESFWKSHVNLMNADNLSPDQIDRFEKFRESEVYTKFETYVDYVSGHGIGSVDRLDPAYPGYMQNLTNMPLVLYYKGDITLLDEKKSRLCIVGTRRPSAYGRRVTREFSEILSRHDLVIVSGLARGVDTHAHEGCLSAGGKTIAVMPCGLDRIYPKENRDLFERIAKEGLLLSELLPGQDPVRKYFPARNRILSAISDCVLITEAGKNSGTLHTASFAAAQGREVFAVPSIIYSETAEGNLSLLRDGASVAIEPEDILAYLAKAVFFRELEEIKDVYDRKVLESKIKEDPDSITSDEVRRIVIDYLSSCEHSVDEIVRESGLPYRSVIKELGKMELEGSVTRERQKYVLTIRF